MALNARSKPDTRRSVDSLYRAHRRRQIRRNAVVLPGSQNRFSKRPIPGLFIDRIDTDDLRSIRVGSISTDNPLFISWPENSTFDIGVSTGPTNPSGGNLLPLSVHFTRTIDVAYDGVTPTLGCKSTNNPTRTHSREVDTRLPGL